MSFGVRENMPLILKRSNMISLLILSACFLLLNVSGHTDELIVQTSEISNQRLYAKADDSAKIIKTKANENSIRLDYLHYRPVSYETEMVQELENVHPNQGGLIYVYYTNISSKPVNFAYWRWNDFDESVWRLDNLISWDRLYHNKINPGQTSVLEINAVSEKFKEGSAYDFEIISKDTWKPAVSHSGLLSEDNVSISLITFKPGLKTAVVHIRNKGDTAVQIDKIQITGKQVQKSELTANTLAPYGHVIGRIDLVSALKESELIVVKADIREKKSERSVMAHRRAFADYFPIGTWGADPASYLAQRRHHIDTCVQGADPLSAFYKEEAERFGYRSLATVNYNDTYDLRTLGRHRAVACLQLSDEPDWVTHPQQVVLQDSIARHAYPYAPTMTTLCRNVTFFEYAPIVDLPCMDHYCVTAPSTSKWPTPFGTKLEETGYYTRDLKAASEPKPIWVWSQGLFDWDERPGQTVPTPEELSVQLMQNIGRGAKGILWFTFREKPGVEYPETKSSIQGWGRVLRLIKSDILRSEPILQRHIDFPSNIDAFALVNFNKLILCITNKDYQMAPLGYQFKDHENFTIKIALPSWIAPESVVDISPFGIKEKAFEINSGQLTISIDDLRDSKVVVASNAKKSGNAYQSHFKSIVSDESRDFSVGVKGRIKCSINSLVNPKKRGIETLVSLDKEKKADNYIFVDISEIGNSIEIENDFLQSDAVRISSKSYPNGLDHYACLNPDGQIVLTVNNDKSEPRTISVVQGNLDFIETIPAKSTASIMWAAQ